MSIVSGEISIIDRQKNKLPIADRLENIKNDIAKLEAEKDELLQGKPDIKRANRLTAIDKQLAILRVRLANATGSK
jgi:hypothetical protein